MNILILNHEYPPVGGGAANACRHLAHELVDQGTRVTVLTAAAAGQPSEFRDNGVRVLRVGPVRRKLLEASPLELIGFAAAAHRAARSLLAEEPFDLLHAFFGVPSGAVCWRLAASTGIPYLISFRGRDVHGGKARESRGIGGWMKAVSRPAWRGASALIANSEGLRDIALDVDPTVDVRVIPNGVDTARFAPAEDRPASGPFELLYVGRLEPYKGLDDLLHALNTRGGCGRRIRLTLAGDGSLRDELPELCRRRGLESAGQFLGPVDPAAIPDLYRKSDAFVLPSHVEGMPNVVLEAMASGLPVIATRIPGSEELVDHGVTGLLVPPGSPEALADALLSLTADRSRRSDMGVKGREAAEARSWEAVARAYLTEYEAILGRPKAKAEQEAPLPVPIPA